MLIYQPCQHQTTMKKKSKVKEERGIKIFNPSKLLKVLPQLLPQKVLPQLLPQKAVENNSYKLKTGMRKIGNLLYQHNKVTDTVTII